VKLNRSDLLTYFDALLLKSCIIIQEAAVALRIDAVYLFVRLSVYLSVAKIRTKNVNSL